ncbi:hypothetical protein HUU62_23130 [Rhodoferax sp. 4810]|uniref:Uncharacterized protein n=1 Tax=Thiospirillum jenense TaxID=1653858 RepID=A0A839HGD5_9GAMM|nr:hypothetical protein [Thiospirillum jenense]MBB1077303.1 hypothetical protein [Rhodoferax jenense]MBB1127070.1 hypothetical protein [Thiospirillum jenense]
MHTILTTLAALSDHQLERTFIAQLHALARRHQFKIETLAMTTDFPAYLQDAYRTEQFNQIKAAFAQYDFWWVGVANQEKVMLYDSKQRLLWDAKPDARTGLYENDGKQKAAQLKLGTLDKWRLPSRDELVVFAANTKNPLRSGAAIRLLNVNYWLCAGGIIDLDRGTSASVISGCSGYLIACNPPFLNSTAESFINAALQNNWFFQPCGVNNAPDLLAPLRGTPDLKTLYSPIDWLAARLPKLEAAQFNDPNKGMWEFWNWDANDLHAAGVRARNPAIDVKDWNVTIDFGTSSTVVAYDDNGQHKLLRIGVQDFWAKEHPSDYENPTVLELLDIAALLTAWRIDAYRPGVLWDQVRCSHEALHRLRHNETDKAVVASVLTKLKQWALRETKAAPVRITSQISGLEHELAPLTLRMPVKGQPLTVSASDPFDPVELYAWFLGLTINWRGRGLFLRYYMTFPVAYPTDIKQKILASFRRGLQRSLPATLVTQPIFAEFSVEELASEPAAYAAAALPLLGVHPTTDGEAYAVFDFGGGTADFDFGRYRLPDASEEDAGWEAVFEHFGVAGDQFLGGENLLENLAYRTFRHNLDLCRQHQIAFTRPLDADDFPGSEMFLEHTQAAQTNTLILIAKLRPLWEQGQLPNSSGVERVALLNRDGGKVEGCELTLPSAALTEYLENRIAQGVDNFLAAMRKAFANNPPQQIHILLAGNASRSQIVARLFGLTAAAPNHDNTNAGAALSVDDVYVWSGEQWGYVNEKSPTADQSTHADSLTTRVQTTLATLFGAHVPQLTVHSPLPVDAGAVFRPTAKTGVALGLLNLCPGGVIKVINHAASDSHGEAPFAYYVGRERHGKFQVGLHQGCGYGEWHELGTPRNRVFNVYYTQLPRAHTGELTIGEPGLFKKRLDFIGDLDGHKVFARAIAPDTIEIATAISTGALAGAAGDNRRELSLK